MRTSKEVQLLRELLAEINGSQSAAEPRFIELQDKGGKTVWLILTRGDGVMYLVPDKTTKTKVKSSAGDLTVLGTPDDIKAIIEA